MIIGQPSFGKGLVQQQITLIDGSAVRITVARYHTPTGRVIQRAYEDGKSEDYYLDHLRRSLDVNYADSVNANAPLFHTLKSGRKVYGDGGISPDILVPMDTTKNYSYWNQLVRAGVINEYVNNYLDNNRSSLLSRYQNFETYNRSFQVSSEMIANLTALGEKRDIKYDSGTPDASMKDIRVHIKALIAQKLWGMNEYFRVVNDEDDAVFDKALETLRDWENAKKILEKP